MNNTFVCVCATVALGLIYRNIFQIVLCWQVAAHQPCQDNENTLDNKVLLIVSIEPDRTTMPGAAFYVSGKLKRLGVCSWLPVSTKAVLQLPIRCWCYTAAAAAAAGSMCTEVLWLPS